MTSHCKSVINSVITHHCCIDSFCCKKNKIKISSAEYPWQSNRIRIRSNKEISIRILSVSVRIADMRKNIYPLIHIRASLLVSSTHEVAPHHSSVQQHLSSTSLLQPIDQSIIANFKRHHRCLDSCRWEWLRRRRSWRHVKLTLLDWHAEWRGVGLQRGPLLAATDARVSSKEMSEATDCCGAGRHVMQPI